MGAAVSSGESNDELVDNLMKYGYIRTRKVEQVFRAVDRADYVLPSHRERAYNDLAWKHGNIHLSAPCIYSEVMESLSLEPGLSFLNLGSGTGYLSTMAGLILNQHGTNHGIELHEDCLNYAYERLEEFKQKSLALDEFDFCEPVFVQGNCLNVTPSRQYNRVYCGAACPENYEGFIKQFVCVGGILIMPFKDHLLRVLRIDEDTWLHFKMLPVSFTTLVVPTASEQTLFHLPESVPLSLQELCRGKIRRCLRSNVWREHEDLETKVVISLRRRRFSPPQQTLTRFVIPVLGESDESVSDESVSDEDDEFTRRLCVLLNVDVDPRDLYPTSQVRAVMLCNMNESQNWQVVNSNSNSNSNVEWNNESPESSTDNNKSVSRTEEDNGVQIASNSTEEKQTENKAEATQNFTNVNETYLNLLKHTETLLNISESDSETEQDETIVQRKKMAKREKTDSGIVEDVNLNNEDSSPRSNNSQSELEPPVDPPDTAEAMDVDASGSPRDQNVIFARYVNSDAFYTYMKEKIHQLPLPFSSKLYLNYNRKL
ncbi:protein-L-isoaspartate O-methyltransferase domain-containing protein 1-like [Frieseomelitta varia]|uniref:protein-L-isoaspartate O-methyltransferase domain-containing protein 1-like n=1 Tax=Frieseomelitta varia TaxID=561572 RepID=UPI001CB68141|nr:protein-L-isoaspartate O-methyltransferase domain-containing protein 1-like [Frieseomelitta varia]XP_043506923.1 protein-L-isoaspartate O-methyltransferase domain-containing protein 1-like [Frieseomelitta varia]XP_043506924.1 protein-L-isoaspartate O-methyltransferase domain-containing protein 1-like [Frieseomelitta varia]XP_043506925.1 protein-L-isoaspartate O-methyltransferase domain-containing protein 1-like [Frieseomelitta varia]XP_043506926.1 protein-L-isoaspartate O-methyltransferase d